MKKIVSFILVVTMCLTTGFSVTFADSWKNQSGKKIPPGLAKKGFLPPGIAKKFSDIEGYSWAEEAIDRMVERGVIKGIGEGRFAPKKAVTKLEAVVMALRVMGEEEIAIKYQDQIKQGKKKLKLKDCLQEWAYGYVALAEEKGILDEADILYFKLNEPAKRHEVAKYIIRALGYEEQAQDNMNADLDFKDAAFIPQGSVGYVYLADKEGIITGYEDETFRPLNTITRVEMAVMVDRLDNIIDDDIDEEEFTVYKGEVEELDKDYEWIKIEIEDEDEKFDITSETEVVFEDDEEGDIEDIEVGDEVKIKVNEADEAVYIEVDRELDYDVYEGLFIEIDDEELSIISSERIIEFEVDSDVEVQFKDREGHLDDLIVGDEVKIVTLEDDDEVKWIEVDRDYTSELITGKIIEVYEDEDQIAIKKDGKIELYDYKSTVKVYINDEEASLSDLEEDDSVQLILDDESVEAIKVYRLIIKD